MLEFVQSAGPVMIWLIVAGFVFCECAFIIGLFLPGDSLLLTAGLAMATTGHSSMSVWGLAVAAFLAAIAGNNVGYRIGVRMGDHVLAKKDGRYLNAHNLHRVKELMDKHGFFSVLIARWIPWVRTLCPLVAGAVGMNKRTFTLASVLGSLIWAPFLLLVGYYASSAFKDYKYVLDWALRGMIVMLVVGTIIGIVGYRREMSKQNVTVDLEH
ncbi:DedA family protein [Tsukamurella spumae]|uniref:DedA family protein n=1 Tax=Tsukamurella spumae TaxID=44753 RepID=A0A846WVE1_9ACTN|nr:DedA family protein [Tsukamurella spumae]NKY17087.1 DedA family protein [Tsukamurella spumae]